MSQTYYSNLTGYHYTVKRYPMGITAWQIHYRGEGVMPDTWKVCETFRAWSSREAAERDLKAQARKNRWQLVTPGQQSQKGVMVPWIPWGTTGRRCT